MNSCLILFCEMELNAKKLLQLLGKYLCKTWHFYLKIFMAWNVFVKTVSSKVVYLVVKSM